MFKKYFSILIAVFIMSFLSTSVFAGNPFSRFFDDKPIYTASVELDKKLLNQTVVLFMFGDGSVGSCSGTIIGEIDERHYILTAKHCIDVTEEMYVELQEVLYVITSISDDLALVVVDGLIPDKKVAKLATFDAWINETVYHIGYPGGVVYKASGKVSRYTKDSQYLDFQVISGCSGGGIFNNNGELVSVVWGGYENPKSNQPLKSVAESLYDVRNFLTSIGVDL